MCTCKGIREATLQRDFREISVFWQIKHFLVSFGHIIHFETLKRNNMTFKSTKKGFEDGSKKIAIFMKNSLQYGPEVFS